MISEDKCKYIIERETVVKVIEVIFDNEKYLVDPKMLFKSHKPKYSLQEARYKIFVKKVSTGTPVKNFKNSKYYKYYMERAKKENPELFFQN